MSTRASLEVKNALAVDLRTLAMGTLLLVATLVAYLPAINGGFVIDDGVNVTRPELRDLHGLWRIWSELGATQQYYPFLYSLYWLEHHVWGDAVQGYHLANILQHAASALLLVAIARRLALPGAWLAGFIFALHPVCVESVAWIAEQKNTLSTALFLGAALAYLSFDATRRKGHYAVASGLFVLALLSKSVTGTLPAALLVVFWWQRGTLEWKRDFRPLLPWIATGAGMGLFSGWVEHKFVGASGEDFALSWLERCLIAGRGAWFYLGKLLWPTDLTFMYPRWNVNPAAGPQYLFLIGLVLLLVGLGWLVRRHRGPLAGFLIFFGLLFPMLGFFDIYWFRISYVADHFVYLPSVGLIMPLAAGLVLACRKSPLGGGGLPAFFGAMLLVLLGTMTWRQSHAYRDYQTLCRETLTRNPSAWMLHHNLGVEVAELPGRLPEAIALFQETLRLKPNFAEAHFNLAQAWSRIPGKLPEAIAEYAATVRLEPGDVDAQFNLGNALATSGRWSEAVPPFEAVVKLRPNFAMAHFNLGNALAATGRRSDAIREYESVLRLEPNGWEAHFNLGSLFMETPRRSSDAIAHFQAVLKLKPDLEPAAQMLHRLQAEAR
jgi:tetratricopeptide (TPR) repeat protein